MSGLMRAIDSVLGQTGVEIELIVVINGLRFDRKHFDAVVADRRLIVVYREEGNVSRARYYGITLATGKFFCFLDDDDELLPLSLITRAQELLGNQAIDIVVSNGFVFRQVDSPLVSDELASNIRDNPVESFLEQNWFASPAPLFRKRSLPQRLFDIPFKYYELTYLYFSLLSAGMNIKYIHALTYRIYQGDCESASASREYALGLPSFLLNLMDLPLSERVKKMLRRKYQVALNSSANIFLSENDAWHAASCHWLCLRSGGWRYLPFTVRLILSCIQRKFLAE